MSNDRCEQAAAAHVIKAGIVASVIATRAYDLSHFLLVEITGIEVRLTREFMSWLYQKGPFLRLILHSLCLPGEEGYRLVSKLIS